MKIIYQFLLLIFLVSIMNVSAISLEIENDQLQKFEILSGKLEGDFEAIPSEQNIKFFEGRREVFFDYETIFYEDVFYFCAYMNKEGNFSIKINDVFYKDAEGLKTESFGKNFLVNLDEKIDENNSTYTEILSIKPCIIDAKDKTKIIFSNKGSKNVVINYWNNTSEIFPGNVESLELLATNKFRILNIESYKNFSIPIFFKLVEKNPLENISTATGLEISPKRFELTSTVNRSINWSINFKNRFYEITKLNLTTFEGLNVNFPIKILYGEEKEIFFNFISNKSGHYEKLLNLTYSENGKERIQQIEFSIFIFPENITEDQVDYSLTCLERGGKYCTDGEYCKQDNNSVWDLCCLTECVKLIKTEEENKGTSVFLGIVIFIGLGIGTFFVWKKFKNVKPGAGQTSFQRVIGKNKLKRKSKRQLPGKSKGKKKI